MFGRLVADYETLQANGANEANAGAVISYNTSTTNAVNIERVALNNADCVLS